RRPALGLPPEQRFVAVHVWRLPRLGGVRARDRRAPPEAGGALHTLAHRCSGARMKRLSAPVELLGPLIVVVLVGLAGNLDAVSPARQAEILRALVSVTIVVSLYVFVGNSGVVSFGHVSFVAVGAFAAGVMTIPVGLKPTITPGLFSVLGRHSVGNVPSLALAAAVGGVFALVVAVPLMRLSGLAAGIATFAVLGVTHNILLNWTKIGPGPL